MLLKHSLITSGGYGKLVTKLIRALKNNKARGYDEIVYLYINFTLIIISKFFTFTGKNETCPGNMFCLQLFPRCKQTWLF